MEHDSTWEADSCSALPFMEPQGSFSRSQDPATDPYFKPGNSSSYINNLFLWNPF
jgi:hypothetical protein